MIGKRIESHFTPGFSVERRNVIYREQVTFGSFASVEVQQDHRFSVAPGRQVLFFRGGAAQLERRIRCELHSLRREQCRGLMMSVARVHAAPAVNHTVPAKSADHAYYLLTPSVAPNPSASFR